jgi:hypothetical protein
LIYQAWQALPEKDRGRNMAEHFPGRHHHPAVGRRHGNDVFCFRPRNARQPYRLHCAVRPRWQSTSLEAGIIPKRLLSAGQLVTSPRQIDRPASRRR